MKCLGCRSRTFHRLKSVEEQQQITIPFERCRELWFSRLTIQDATAFFCMSWNTVCEIDLKLRKKFSHSELSGLMRLGIDGVYRGKLHKFVTLFGDLVKCELVALASGHGQADTGCRGHLLFWWRVPKFEIRQPRKCHRNPSRFLLAVTRPRKNVTRQPLQRTRHLQEQLSNKQCHERWRRLQGSLPIEKAFESAI